MPLCNCRDRTHLFDHIFHVKLVATALCLPFAVAATTRALKPAPLKEDRGRVGVANFEHPIRPHLCVAEHVDNSTSWILPREARQHLCQVVPNHDSGRNATVLLSSSSTSCCSTPVACRWSELRTGTADAKVEALIHSHCSCTRSIGLARVDDCEWTRWQHG